MLLEELFNDNDTKMLEVLNKLTPEDIGDYVFESFILVETNPFHLHPEKRSGEGEGEDESGILANVPGGMPAATSAVLAYRAANKMRRAAGHALNQKRAQLVNKTTPSTKRGVLKKAKLNAKAIGSEVGQNAKSNKLRTRGSITAAQADAAKRAQANVDDNVKDWNKKYPDNKFDPEKVKPAKKKAANIASKIAARHAAATLLGGGFLSWATNAAALGWDVWDIYNWYQDKNNSGSDSTSTKSKRKSEVEKAKELLANPNDALGLSG